MLHSFPRQSALRRCQPHTYVPLRPCLRLRLLRLTSQPTGSYSTAPKRSHPTCTFLQYVRNNYNTFDNSHHPRAGKTNISSFYPFYTHARTHARACDTLGKCKVLHGAFDTVTVRSLRTGKEVKKVVADIDWQLIGLRGLASVIVFCGGFYSQPLHRAIRRFGKKKKKEKKRKRSKKNNNNRTSNVDVACLALATLP